MYMVQKPVVRYLENLEHNVEHALCEFQWLLFS